MPSDSGGDLAVMMELTPIGLEKLDQSGDDDDEVYVDDVSMVGFVAEKLQNATLSSGAATSIEKKNSIDDENERDEELPWSGATSRSEAISIIAALLHSSTWHGWRATGEVVAIMNQSERRSTMVGVLKKAMFGGGGGNVNQFNLIPRDPRLPRDLVHPAALQRSLGAEASNALFQEARNEDVVCRTLISAKITSWAVYLGLGFRVLGFRV